MTLTLYASPGACSLAPHIVLQEIGAPFKLEIVTHGPGAFTQSAAYLKMNPKGRVPLLVDGDAFQLTESTAILLHLAQAHPDIHMMPSGPDGLVRAVEWFNWLSSAVHAVAVRMIWRPDFFTQSTAAEDHAAIIAKGHVLLSDAHALIEARLQGRAMAVGETYSIVDPYLLVYYRWGNRMKLDMVGRYPAWTAHAKRLEQRPAVQRALKAEGISIWA